MLFVLTELVLARTQALISKNSMMSEAEITLFCVIWGCRSVSIGSGSNFRAGIRSQRPEIIFLRPFRDIFVKFCTCTLLGWAVSAPSRTTWVFNHVHDYC